MADEEPPFVDEHAIMIEQPIASVWAAVVHVAERASSGSAATLGARLLGCADVAEGGPRPLAAGSSASAWRDMRALEGRRAMLGAAIRTRVRRLT